MMLLGAVLVQQKSEYFDRGITRGFELENALNKYVDTVHAGRRTPDGRLVPAFNAISTVERARRRQPTRPPSRVIAEKGRHRLV